MTPLRLAFMGTPDFAVQSLRALLDAGHHVVAVYTQPPSPRGRGQVLQPSPVQAFAEARGLEVRTPKSMRDPDAIAGFRALDLDAATLHDRLAVLGAALWPEALAAIAAGTAVETPQAETGATYARKITPAEARIDWSRPAVEIDRQIRGLSPFPGAWFVLETPKGPVRVKALDSRLALGDGAPGEVLDDQLRVACGTGAVRLLRLQREGRAAADAQAFLRGLPVTPSERLG